MDGERKGKKRKFKNTLMPSWEMRFEQKRKEGKRKAGIFRV